MTDEKKPDEDVVSDEQLDDVAGGKISVGSSNDKLEQEADGVAEGVMKNTHDTAKNSNSNIG